MDISDAGNGALLKKAREDGDRSFVASTLSDIIVAGAGLIKSQNNGSMPLDACTAFVKLARESFQMTELEALTILSGLLRMSGEIIQKRMQEIAKF